MPEPAPLQPPRGTVRFIGDLPGHYTLSARQPAAPHRVEVFACRARSISSALAVLDAPVVGQVGAGVTLQFDMLGLVKGRIARRLASGFVVEIETTASEEHTLSERTAWMKKHGTTAADDRRQYRRWLPRVPRSQLTLADGRHVECFVIDVSASGAAISADVVPALGATLTVGAIPGTVVRFLPLGFGVQFIAPQDPRQIESLLAVPPAPPAG